MRFSVGLLVLCVSLRIGAAAEIHAAGPVRVGVFQVDASPPVGSPLAYDPTKGVQTPLTFSGVVILSDHKPIVLAVIDWLGVANEASLEFRERLAKAAGTSVDRVSMHAVHQHDAPRCDFSVDRLLRQHGIDPPIYDTAFARDVLSRAATSVKNAVANARVVTQYGIGRGTVEKVASNRRILGPDGKVKVTRYTATRDPKVRAEPVGTIDPELKLISFWDTDDKPIAALTYYATHPQSYYRTGLANPDFPGLARNQRSKETGTPHIHFNGAGGNIGAGKWNDGSKANRQVLADRVAAGMKAAWESTEKFSLDSSSIGWKTIDVLLPPSPHLDAEKLKTALAANSDIAARRTAGKDLVWLNRVQKKDPVHSACLQLGDARIVHLPGELFVEYQLAAQKMATDKFVAVAAYGDYGPGYIGTAIAYTQGGYETSARASRVGPGSEKVLMKAIRELLSD